MAQNLDRLRHSLAHLLGAAVLHLYPDAKLSIGPSIENGFYYDIDFPSPISDDALPKIEGEMRKILPAWKEFSHQEVSADEARKHFRGNPYKRELIDELEAKGETIALYTCGDFTDLCRGGHVEHPSKEIDPKSFKLEKLAGAYWRGDEKNAQLTRIYGLAFGSAKELDEYVVMFEEAKKRDHRILGRELGLFVIVDEIGPGCHSFTQKVLFFDASLKILSLNFKSHVGILRFGFLISPKESCMKFQAIWESTEHSIRQSISKMRRTTI
jgi:threonyl-tRNA synthetase